MQEEIKKLNKLIEKLNKNIRFIKSGAVIDQSGKSPITINRVIYHKELNILLFMTDQLDDYICFDVDSFDKAMAVKETI